MVQVVLPAMPSWDQSDVLVSRNELVNCDVNKRIKATWCHYIKKTNKRWDFKSMLYICFVKGTLQKNEGERESTVAHWYVICFRIWRSKFKSWRERENKVSFDFVNRKTSRREREWKKSEKWKCKARERLNRTRVHHNIAKWACCKAVALTTMLGDP